MRLPRVHKSSIVIAAVVAVLLVLVNVPGRVVDWRPGKPPSWTFEHGWPYVYLRRHTYEPPPRYVVYSTRWFHRNLLSQRPMWGIPWLSAANWRAWESRDASGTPQRRFNGAILLADVVVALVVLAAVVTAWEIRRRCRPTLFSFTLSDMLVAVAAVCMALAWLRHMERQFERERPITDNFWADPDYPISARDEVCVAPAWLRSLTGERLLPSFFWRFGAVAIWTDDVDDAKKLCEEIAKLPSLKKIEVTGLFGDGTRFPFSALRAVKSLETLEVDDYYHTDNSYGTIDEQDVGELTQLSGLRKLVLWDKESVSPELLAGLEAELPNCRIVDVRDDW